jgi:phosphohistidine phosphatase
VIRRLTLLRHGHAEPETDAGDFARKLDPRGHAEAHASGARLHALHLQPQLVLASPARRTEQTAKEIIASLELPPERLHLEARLYLADSDTITEIAARTADAVHHLLIVGHNPGLSDCAAQFGGHRAHPLVTGAYCSLAFELPHWRDLPSAAAESLRQEAPSARAT